MTKSVYMIAGEASGDILGGRLLAALKAKETNLIIRGIGGDNMQSHGLHSLFPMEELSVMGLTEVLPRIPDLLKRINQTAQDIIHHQPDIVITIDSPDFVKRVVKKTRVKCQNTKFIHYVAPSVWAWRAGRAKTMAKLYDGLICLLPFEPPYFEKEGLRSAFCGHPAIETIDAHQNERNPNRLLILPGSRLGEVSKMAPVFAETLEKLRQSNHELKASIVALLHVKPIIEDTFKDIQIDYIKPESRFAAFKTAGKALATSGTVGLELAVAGCPHVIAYQMSPLTYWIGKRMVKVDYGHLVNIMEGREVIPEYIQDNCTSDNLTRAIQNLDIPELTSIRQKLSGSNPGLLPSEQAADFVRSFL